MLPRTWLFGPGADDTVHAAMAGCGAQALIQDLEDFTPPEQRRQARALAPQLLASWRSRGARTCVRVNALDGEGLQDLAAVVAARPDFIAYPKATSAADMRALDEAISRAEQAADLPLQRIGIVPVCETALGVVNVREIAAASARIRFALLGASDLVADLMADRSRDGGELDHARRRFLLECRAAGIEPIDANYAFSDAEGAVAEARLARRLGYRCKSVLRPEHAAAVLAALLPDDAELARARRIVAAFEAARTQQVLGGVLVDGTWIEVPTVQNARRLLQSVG